MWSRSGNEIGPLVELRGKYVDWKMNFLGTHLLYSYMRFFSISVTKWAHLSNSPRWCVIWPVLCSYSNGLTGLWEKMGFNSNTQQLSIRVLHSVKWCLRWSRSVPEPRLRDYRTTGDHNMRRSFRPRKVPFLRTTRISQRCARIERAVIEKTCDETIGDDIWDPSVFFSTNLADQYIIDRSVC